MLKNWGIVLVIACCLGSCISLKHITYKTVDKKLSPEQLLKCLQTLSSDSLSGRNPKDEQFDLTVSFIENQLKKSKIDPFFGASYKDTFLIDRTISFNLVGIINNNQKTDSCILICAHYDHLGIKNTEKIKYTMAQMITLVVFLL